MIVADPSVTGDVARIGLESPSGIFLQLNSAMSHPAHGAQFATVFRICRSRSGCTTSRFSASLTLLKSFIGDILHCGP
jgi:hypothetical protein